MESVNGGAHSDVDHASAHPDKCETKDSPMKQTRNNPPPVTSPARWIPAAALAAAATASLHAATPASSTTTSPSATVVPAVKTVADSASIPFSSHPGATLLYIR